MHGSSESGYLAATANEHATSPGSSPQLSAASAICIMDKMKESDGSSSVEQQIERSKCHWSELTKSDFNEDEVADNVEVFKTLQMHSTWGRFFMTFGHAEGRSLVKNRDLHGKLVMGKKFAEGGQAELYYAQVKWYGPEKNVHDLKYGIEYVLKVFKKGTLSQWPQEYFQFQADLLEKFAYRKPDRNPKIPRYYSVVYCGTLLYDRRFAFLMVKEQVDLRSLIDCQVTSRTCKNCGPFLKDEESCETLQLGWVGFS